MLPVQVFFAKKNAEFFSIKRAAVSFRSEKTLGRNKETSCRDNSQTSPPQEIFIRAATKEMHHSPLLLPQKIPVLLSRSFSAARKSPFGSLRKKHLPANFATIKRGTPIFPANVAAKEGYRIPPQIFATKRNGTPYPFANVAAKKGTPPFPVNLAAKKRGTPHPPANFCHKKERHSVSLREPCHKKGGNANVPA